VFVTLRFLATGCFLQVVADFGSIYTGTASRIVHKVTRAIPGLHNIFIRMPSSANEMAANSTAFYRISRMPQWIGAIDCSHVKISSPDGRQPEIYRNRKCSNTHKKPHRKMFWKLDPHLVFD
jgi:hypothetical protein